MNIKQDLEVFKAINLIAELIGKEPQDVCARVAFFDDTMMKKITEPYNNAVTFYSKPLEEKAKDMGFEVSVNETETTISTTL
jgi:hypothetical protein